MLGFGGPDGCDKPDPPNRSSARAALMGCFGPPAATAAAGPAEPSKLPKSSSLREDAPVGKSCSQSNVADAGHA
eukprot:scaffold226837_cov21-Prasinocladus_malaysianus.AAC.1